MTALIRFSQGVGFPFNGLAAGKPYSIAIERDAAANEWRCMIDFNPRLPLKSGLATGPTEVALRQQLTASGFMWPADGNASDVCRALLSDRVLEEVPS